MKASLAASALILSAARGGASLAGLLTVMILARLLSQKDFGIYQQVWLVYNTALPFMMLGIPAGITYFVSQADKAEQKMIVVQTSLLLGLMGLILSFGTYLFSNELASRFGGAELSDLLRAFFWYPLLSFPLLVVDVFLIAVRRPAAAGVLTILASIIQLACVTIPIALGYSLLTVIYILSCATLVKLLVFGPIILKEYRQVPYSWNWGFMRHLLAYTIPLGLAAVFATLAMQIGKWVVAIRFSAAEYAVFAIAARELPFIGIITGSIMAVLIPEFVRQYERKDLKEILRLWHAATSKTALFLIPLTGLLAVFAKDVVVILYSDKYLPAVGVFLVYLSFLPLRITQYGALLKAAGESSLILWIHVAALPLCFALCFVLTSSLGPVGAAIGTVLTIYAVAAALLVRCTQILKVGLSEIFPWNKLTRIALGTATASVSALWATSTITPGVVRLALGTLIFGLLTVIILWSMGTTRQEIRIALTAIRNLS